MLLSLSLVGVQMRYGATWRYKREQKEASLHGAKENAAKAEENEEETYSEPDEGVEIVDMENVRAMDWMAPESLRKERKTDKKKKIKLEEAEKKKGEQLHSK